jgi:c-di-GMP-binding flagellar brake protein YcgR
MSPNRRKHPRVSIHVPVNYALLDGRGKIESEFIGVALDVSLGGLLLESFDFAATEHVGISFIDAENNIAQITCKMAYSRKTDLGMVHTGLSFQGSEAEKSDFAAKMIRAYFYRKKRTADNGLMPSGASETEAEPCEQAWTGDENASS